MVPKVWKVDPLKIPLNIWQDQSLKFQDCQIWSLKDEFWRNDMSGPPSIQDSAKQALGKLFGILAEETLKNSEYTKLVP